MLPDGRRIVSVPALLSRSALPGPPAAGELDVPILPPCMAIRARTEPRVAPCGPDDRIYVSSDELSGPPLPEVAPGEVPRLLPAGARGPDGRRLGSRVPSGSAAALARLEGDPLLGDAAWVVQARGSRTVDELPRAPSLSFPAGITYAEALSALYASVALAGTLPSAGRLAPALPDRVVLLRSPRETAIDLRARSATRRRSA